MELFLGHPLVREAFAWAAAEQPPLLPAERHCETRDILYARLDSIRVPLMRRNILDEKVLLLHAVLSEIGGNSFDHNLGQWRDMPGAYFGTSFADTTPLFVLADRGQGIRATLCRVRPTIADDAEALRVAFLERLSGRAPERRGNGLKFVRKTLLEDGINLFFQSGTATYHVEKRQEEWGSLPPLVGCFAVLSFVPV